MASLCEKSRGGSGNKNPVSDDADAVYRNGHYTGTGVSDIPDIKWMPYLREVTLKSDILEQIHIVKL